MRAVRHGFAELLIKTAPATDHSSVRSGHRGGAAARRGSAEPLRLVESSGADYAPINSYGMIGDLHTVALVGPDGSIDWMCAPFVDSPSVFGALLDAHQGGRFRVAPTAFTSSRMRYTPNTNILESTFESGQGEAVVTDFMPIETADGSKTDPDQVLLCRKIECTRGAGVDIEIEFDPQPDYARSSVPLVRHKRRVESEDGRLVLRVDQEVKWDPATGVGRFHLPHGTSAYVVLAVGNPPELPPLDTWVDRQLRTTRDFWERWVAQSLYRGRWRNAVVRSALTLKLMIFKPTGGIFAAPTTSLPETVGGERNWDYRFSWLRDSALTLNALFVLGFRDEATAYMEWLTERVLRDEELKILYPVRDEELGDEETLLHLSGYRDSKPVRIGNAAADQVQLDVYGELLEAIFLYGVYVEPVVGRLWECTTKLANLICERWQERDEGIWEVRSGRANFTHSKILCGAGLDRAARIARERGDTERAERWEATRDTVMAYIRDHCVDPEEGYLTQSAEVRTPDASTLLAVFLECPPSDDDSVRRTIEVIEERLTRDGLVYRYHADDGLSGQEGTFNLCTFWLVEALALSGREDAALAGFHRMLSVASPVGLFAEETDPETLEALGNYPQAFTHIGLINAALALNQLGTKLA